jgi:CP family cyanate transporter-like MFS transporter
MRPVGSVACLCAIFLVAMNLRPGLASVSPVLPTILRDFGVGTIYGGLLTTVPVVCMGVFAPVSLRVAARLGAERTVLLSVTLVGATTLARLWSPGPVALLVTAFAIGVGIAIAGTLLPALAKAYFPGRVTLATGIYAIGINLGAGCAAIGTAPVTKAIGSSWRAGLAGWSLLTLPAIVLWLPLTAQRQVALAPRSPQLPLRSRHAWMVTGFFGAQSFVYYGILTWLATLYEELGWSRTHAGVLLALFTLLQMLGALTMSAGANRSGDLTAWIRVSAVLSITGLLLIALVPDRAPWLWVAILGLGVGGIFPLSLTLPLVSTRTAQEAREWTSMTLGVGYLVAAAGPIAIGALRSLTGGFGVAFVLLAAINVVIVACVPWMVPRRPTVRR